jgi:hypothetical protein
MKKKGGGVIFTLRVKRSAGKTYNQPRFPWEHTQHTRTYYTPPTCFIPLHPSIHPPHHPQLENEIKEIQKSPHTLPNRIKLHEVL